MVEGSLMGGYEQGLESGLYLAAGISAARPEMPVELVVAGRVAPQVQAAADARAMELSGSHSFSLQWAGLVERDRIPALDRSAHVLFSSDINAACPNSVSAALACVCPVVAYDTGALPELLMETSGRLAAYGGDPWKLDPPDREALVQAALPVLAEQERYRRAARQRAESALSLDKMVAGYLQALQV
jgi:glycosyltransferase involved in cell wall biosynthesis